MAKIIFATVIGVHGLIHVLGFLKAFGFARLTQLTQTISRPVGITWAVTSGLFIGVAILFGLKVDWWWIVGLLAVVPSQALIIGSWQDAKFGTVLNVVILVGIVLGFGAWNFDRKVSGEIETVLPGKATGGGKVVAEESIDRLPQPVQKWLRTAGVPGARGISTVKLSQRGELRLNPDQSWSSVKAEQYVNTEDPAFIWRVNMRLFSIIPVAGRDKFADGKGDMEIKIGSLFPVVSGNSNEKLNQAALQRYLAELGWYPTAALKPYINWKKVDERTAEATMEYRGTSGSVTFHFTEDYDLEKISAMRYRDSGEDAKKKEWFGEVRETEVVNGLRIPTEIDISWVLEDGVFTWYRFEVTDMEFDFTE